jgi:hypothetical protein
MSGFRRCQGCGRRLTDVLFCTQCGGWFCCPACLSEDNIRHLRAKAALVSDVRPPSADAVPSMRQTVMFRWASRSR